ncbi:MAG TPA: hypothetical protein ENJ28_03415, partial [Gammaproteobacteria bacterium]|nr:hypothetical protein [Gammaproteobacteria bacterium]
MIFLILSYLCVKSRFDPFVVNIEQSDHKTLQPDCLYPFVGNPREDMPDGLPFKLEEYVELVDLTGRQIREGKKGSTLLCSCNRDINA